MSYFTFEIRPEAQWDNGSPVTAHDVALSLKLIHSPLLDNERWRAQFDFIKDIKLYSSHPKRLTIVCSGYSTEMKLMAGDFFVLPAYIFDPNSVLSSIPLKLVRDKFDSLATSNTFKSYASFINQKAMARDTSFVKGSGPYRLSNWKTGQILILDKKSNWWGNKVSKGKSVFNSKPSKIVFQVIPDNAAALLALKTKQLDLMDNIPVVPFIEMKKDKKYNQAFNFYSSPSYDLAFIGINGNKSYLKDNLTRQALAHLVNIPELIQVLQGGFANSTVGIVHPHEKQYYHTNLKPFPFDVKEAHRLLNKAGWKQTPAGWKRKNGRNDETLTLSLLYRGGNSESENIALLFKQNAQSLGIKINLQALESSQIGEKLNNRDYDLFIRTLVGNPYSYNFIHLFHTSNTHTGGANVTGFGTPATDELLERIAKEEDPAEKAVLLKKLQEKMQEESNLIFLYFLQNKMAISKQIDSVVVSGIKPGYDVTRFVKKK
ncbi:hypothetical protein GCM10011405_32050 [Rufibacter glacialis]|nr:hypothetical protein GCM10011405_32050 [Rufibacter glacialis]